MPRGTRSKSRVVELFRALAHDGRLAVLLLLEERGRLCAGDLQRELGIEQSALSHQLRVLHEARLVKRTRRGRHLEYELADLHVAHIVADAMTHAAEPERQR